MAMSRETFTLLMPDGSTVTAKNQIRIHGDDAFIRASNASTEWTVDVGVLPMLVGIRWSDAGKSLPYAKGHNGRQVIYMHRLLCLGCIDGLEVDHVSRVATDNRRANLRPVTRSGNASNMTPRRGTASGYPCVVWDKSKNRWSVQTSIMIAPGQHQMRNFGRFKQLNDACKRSHEVLTSLGRFAPPIPFLCL